MRIVRQETSVQTDALGNCGYPLQVTLPDLDEKANDPSMGSG